MKPRPALFASALAAFALLCAGCGDDDDATSTDSRTTGASGATGAEGSSEAPLPADVVAEGNEICADGGEQLAQAYGELPLQANEPDDAFVRDEVLPILQGQIDALRELDESKELQTVLDDIEESIARIESDPQQFIAGGPFAPKELKALGLDACASMGSSAPY